MASTYTPLGVELQATGENAGTWGTKTNTNLQIIEQISGGFTQQSIAGGAQTTALSVSDGSTGAVLSHRMIEFTGTITGNQIVTIPLDVQTFYFLRNSTSGAYTVQFKYVSGSGDTFTFATTDKGDQLVFATANDGTNPDIITLNFGDVTLGGTETLTNKTLTSPKIGTSILDTNGNELALLTATSSAVNEFTVANAATGAGPTISSTGDDSNIDINITPKGTGDVVLAGDTVKVGDSGAAATLTSNGAGALTVTTGGAADLVLSTNSGTDSGTITITDAANGNISLVPNGTGDVVLSADTVTVGDDATAAVLTSQGAGTLTVTTGGASDLILNTNSGTDSSSITITDAANGNISLTNNGTGEVVIGSGTASGKITTSGANDLVLDTNSGTNSGNITITDAANGDITISPNGTGVAKAVDAADATGAIKIAGKETMWVPAVAMYPNTTSGCADLAQTELGNGPELKTLDFDKDSDEFAQFAVAFPKSWNEGTITFQAFFTADSTNTGTTSWALQGVALADDGSLNTAFGTAVAPTAKAHSGTANDLDVTAESGAVTIAGSPSTDEYVFFQISRDVSADDLTADAKLLGIKLFFTTDAANDG